MGILLSFIAQSVVYHVSIKQAQMVGIRNSRSSVYNFEGLSWLKSGGHSFLNPFTPGENNIEKTSMERTELQ